MNKDHCKYCGKKFGYYDDEEDCIKFCNEECFQREAIKL